MKIENRQLKIDDAKKREDIIGFFDARCKCGTRIGWYGTLKNRPPCTRCGEVVEPSVLSEDERRLRDGEIFCQVQTLYFECKNLLSQGEFAFIKNMYKKHLSKEPYNSTQINSIHRMFNQYSQNLTTKGTKGHEVKNQCCNCKYSIPNGSNFDCELGYDLVFDDISVTGCEQFRRRI